MSHRRVHLTVTKKRVNRATFWVRYICHQPDKQELIMRDKKTGPRVIHSTPGRPLAAEPHAADYCKDISEAAYAAIDAAHPQDLASQGRVVSAFNW